MQTENLHFIKNYRTRILHNKEKNYHNFSNFPKIFFTYKFYKNFDTKKSKQKVSFLNKLSMTTSRKYGYLSGENNFPTIWSVEERYNWLYIKKKFNGWGDLEISSNCLRIKYKGFGLSDEDAAAIRTNNSIPNHLFLFYFEIKILSIGKKGFIGVGLCGKNEGLNRLPGWEKNSLGYHGDDGFIFRDSGTGSPYGPRYVKNDIIGLCLNLYEKSLFFTKNGLGLNSAFIRLDHNFLNEIYPLIGLRTKGETIIANFGMKPFEFDIHYYKRNVQTSIENKISSYKTNFLYCFSYFQNWLINKKNIKQRFISNFFFLKENISKKKFDNNQKLLFHDLIVKNYRNSFFLMGKKSFLLKKSWNKLFYFFILWTTRSFLDKLFNKITNKVNNFSKGLRNKNLIHFVENKFITKVISQNLKKKRKKYFDTKNNLFLNFHLVFQIFQEIENTNPKVSHPIFSIEMLSTCYFDNNKSKSKNISRFLLYKHFKYIKILNLVKKKKNIEKSFNKYQKTKLSALDNYDYFFLMPIIEWVI